MAALLSAEKERQSEMYEHQYYDWLMLQARLIREGNIKDADLVHIAEELEDMGNEVEAALVSFFKQTMVHLCKLRYSKDAQSAQHWKGEIANFRTEIEERAVNRFTNEKKIEDIYKKAWKGATSILRNSLRPEEFSQIPVDCPFTLEQVRTEEFFPDRQ